MRSEYQLAINLDAILLVGRLSPLMQTGVAHALCAAEAE
jgi:hypothetical protein